MDQITLGNLIVQLVAIKLRVCLRDPFLDLYGFLKKYIKNDKKGGKGSKKQTLSDNLKVTW